MECLVLGWRFGNHHPGLETSGRVGAGSGDPRTARLCPAHPPSLQQSSPEKKSKKIFRNMGTNVPHAASNTHASVAHRQQDHCGGQKQSTANRQQTTGQRSSGVQHVCHPAATGERQKSKNKKVAKRNASTLKTNLTEHDFVFEEA
jgi:hypothetical protein